MEIDSFQPQLGRTHLYAVALRIAGGGVAPLHSYETEAELREGYKKFYQHAVKSNLHKPIAIMKQSPLEEWNKAICVTLPDIMIPVIEEERNKGSNNN